MEAFVRTVALDIATLIDAAAVLLIALSTLEALGRWVATLPLLGGRQAEHELVRIRLAQRLTLALEFLIGSDIVRTAVEPGWAEIGQLAAVVGLRVLITYTLAHEPPIREGDES